MKYENGHKKLPPVGIYHALYNGDHVIFQVHDGGFRIINYHGEKNDSPNLNLVKWLDEAEPSYTNDDFESWVNKTWPQFDNSSAACRNAANKAMEWIRGHF